MSDQTLKNIAVLSEIDPNQIENNRNFVVEGPMVVSRIRQRRDSLERDLSQGKRVDQGRS